MLQPILPRKLVKPLAAAGIVLLAAILLAAIHAKTAYANSKPIDVYVNDEPVAFAIEPDIKAGTTVVQMRPLFEALGMDVTWNGKDRTVTAEMEGVRLLLTLDSQAAEVNGRAVKLDRPAVSVKGHTMVPLRFVSESTGALVHWNGVHREILVYTPDYVALFGLTLEDVKAWLDDLQKQIDEEHAAAKAKDAEKKDDDNRKPAVVLPPELKDDGNPVRLDRLQGMYYGGQYDYGGYECGGVCWIFYTFLPDNKVVVGLPKGGGPETIDCKKDSCLSYSIKDGKLNIQGEDPLPISINKDGALEIDQVHMRKVLPVPDGTTFSGEYISQGYYGLVGITPYSTSWTNYMTFYADGTFTSDQTSLASLDTGSARTDSVSAGDTVKGTYKISGNTIELKYEDGTVERHVFAIPPRSDEGRVYVQIGSQSFHLNTD